MRPLRSVLAIVLVAASVVAALLAADVHAWHSALRNGDAVYVATPSRATWRADTHIGGAASTLLGIDDDVAARKALQAYVDASKLHLRLDNAAEVEAARGHVQDALERVARSTDRPRAAQALTLLGVLAFRSSASGGGDSQVDAAITDFTDAVRSDPQNVAAAFDLELLLRLTAARGTRVQPGQGGGFGRSGHRGAGSGQPGSGY